MRDASRVASLRSFSAPVEMLPSTSRSAAWPPISTRSRDSSSACAIRCRSAPGLCCVTPSAMPRGMMLTRCSGSVAAENAATTAWPASWTATRCFSLASSFASRGSPRTILSYASAKSAAAMLSRPSRVAASAASLTRLARSAPENPAVFWAMTCRIDVERQRLALDVHAQDRLCGRPARAGRRGRADRSGPGAAARDRARRDGWSPRSRPPDRCARSRPSRRAAGSASARARRCRRRARRRAPARPRRSRR